MGGRGAAANDEYGTAYRTLAQSGNIKIIKQRSSGSTKTPMESRTPNRIYAVVDRRNRVKSITFHESNGKRYKQIDLTKPHNGKKPHVHMGFEHNEGGGTRGKLSKKEKRIVGLTERMWSLHDG